MSTASDFSGSLDSPDPADDSASDESYTSPSASPSPSAASGSDSASTTTSTRNAASPSSLRGLKEIGNLASWTVSTAKPGNSIPQLRSDDTNEFWQSDGPQPHYINIHFAKRVRIAKIRMYLDFENDESYTPTRMQLVAGTGYHDLSDVAKVELERPCGWIDIPLGEGVHEDGELRTWLVQLQILSNHQNGKDTHIRGLQVFAREVSGGERGGVGWTSQRMLEELEIR
ncbi:APC10-domain-containing protein [Ascodesmis nigricans]|uniref:APC10-domain-containing protein n=1 Tax=Ascodesmis nigricans TaxID=341454 RepID=A0A4S2N2U7_9PEZI|nr:APC10-domain-containing protein [Ascodesmis nigricans]